MELRIREVDKGALPLRQVQGPEFYTVSELAELPVKTQGPEFFANNGNPERQAAKRIGIVAYASSSA